MNTSATLPNTIQIRPSRLTGLLIAVAILTGVTTWSVSQITTDSHTSSTTQAGLGDQTARRTLGTPTSQRPAAVLTQPYVDRVVALDSDQRAAIYGNLTPTQQYGNVGGAGAFIPPAHANGVDGAGGPLAAVGGAGAFIPFTPPES